MSKFDSPYFMLDTHIWLWMMNGTLDKDYPEACKGIRRSLDSDGVRIAAISVWEIAMLVSKKRISLPTDALSWAMRALNAPGLELEELSPQIAVASNQLPGSAPSDPADRMIIASAMSLGAVLVTHDREMLSYAETHRLPHLAI